MKMLPCQGPFARSSLLALMLLLVTGVQLAPPGILSAPSGELTAVGESIPAPAKSGEAITTTVKSVPSSNPAGGDLLDQEKLTFLAGCQAQTGTIGKGDAMLCDVYRNLSVVLAARKQGPVTAKTVQEMLAEQDPSGTERFCENLVPVLKALPGQFGGVKPLENEAVCANLCLPVDEVTFHVTLKPICRVLLWGFRRLLLPDEVVDPAVRAAQEVVPPLVDEGLKLEKVEPKADATTKLVAKPDQKTSAVTAHVTPSTNAAAAAPGVADKPAESVAKEPPAGEEHKLADEKTLSAQDQKDQNELFVDQEAKNKQNLEDINGEGGLKDGLDGPADEDAMYQEGEGGSDEDPSMDTNVPTAAGTAPKEVVAREEDQQPDSLEPQPRVDHKEGLPQQQQQQELPDPFFEEGDSNFFSYFLFVMFACIVCYVGYHNKSKLLALALEGRRSSTGRGGFSKGRKHTAAYRKLDSNLEEAIMSNSAASSRSQQQIIY